MSPRRLRPRHGRGALLRAAILVFLVTVAVVGTVGVVLDRNARHANEQQASLELAGAARVAAATASRMRADLRGRVGELATSLELQRAVVDADEETLARFARANEVEIWTRRRTYGDLSRRGMPATATIADRRRVLARVTARLAADDALLRSIQEATPLREHAALLFADGGRIVAGGPSGAELELDAGRFTLGSTSFVAASAPLRNLPGATVVALEPLAAVEARVVPYRRRLLVLAILTLAVAAAVATRLARPLADVLGDLARFRHQAETDSLTGLANRRAFDDRLARELAHARHAGGSLSLVIADIDDFKRINDAHGHQTGDEVLRAVAQVVAATVRHPDLPARLGGEELAVVLPGAALGGARRTAERVRRAIENLQLVAASGERIAVTASFGAAEFPTQATESELLAAADEALYAAKRSGKNRVAAASAPERAAAEPLAATANAS